MRLERAEDGFEVVDVLGKRGVGEGFAEAGSVEGDFDGVRGRRRRGRGGRRDQVLR